VGLVGDDRGLADAIENRDIQVLQEVERRSSRGLKVSRQVEYASTGTWCRAISDRGFFESPMMRPAQSRDVGQCHHSSTKCGVCLIDSGGDG
jgi:hypothetical protein